ncbi:MAG: hypothetical protein ABIU54_07585, partial [Candidatus Eisenbacteria bacterium]
MKRFVLAVTISLLTNGLAFAWSGSPVRVDGVTTGPALVAAAHDGAFGVLIAWRPGGSTGPVRVSHLLGDGSTDPTWPQGGLTLSSGSAACTGLNAIADAHGGAYIYWQEGQSLYLTRVLDSGAVAPGWYARGRRLGLLSSNAHRPWAESDAWGGLYMGWFQGNAQGFQTPVVSAIHLGLNGSGAGGWPNSARSLPLDPDFVEWVAAASFAISEDGGVWALVATGRLQDSVGTAGEWRLGRFLANGSLEPGRPAQGTVLATFDPTALELNVPRIAIGAVVADRQGGVLTAMATVSENGVARWSATGQLERRLSDGSLHPAQGPPRQLGFWYESAIECDYVGACEPAAYSLRLIPEAAGGIALASPQSYTHAGLVLFLERVDLFGARIASLVDGWGPSPDYQMTPNLGYLLSSFDVSGPGPYNPAPELRLRWSDGRSTLLEEDFSPYNPVYADLAAVGLADGGAIAVWSRILGNTGLFAQRVGADGSVLGAPPSPLVTSRLRLTRSGQNLSAAWPAGAPGTLRVFDLQGRDIA